MSFCRHDSPMTLSFTALTSQAIRKIRNMSSLCAISLGLESERSCKSKSNKLSSSYMTISSTIPDSCIDLPTDSRTSGINCSVYQIRKRCSCWPLSYTYTSPTKNVAKAQPFQIHISKILPSRLQYLKLDRHTANLQTNQTPPFAATYINKTKCR